MFRGTDLEHLGHVALRACVFSGVLHLHQDQEVDVVPHVVLRCDVLLKGHRLVVELVPLQPCEGGGVYGGSRMTNHKSQYGIVLPDSYGITSLSTILYTLVPLFCADVFLLHGLYVCPLKALFFFGISVLHGALPTADEAGGLENLLLPLLLAPQVSERVDDDTKYQVEDDDDDDEEEEKVVHHASSKQRILGSEDTSEYEATVIINITKREAIDPFLLSQ